MILKEKDGRFQDRREKAKGGGKMYKSNRRKTGKRKLWLLCAVPEGQLESALLPAGPQVYASESEKSLFIRQDGGYVQYQPMEGMQEEVEEVLAVRPTGEVPGYEYVEADCIYYSAGQMKCLPRIFTAQPAMRGTWSARATVIREGFWSGTGREMYGSCTRPGIPMRMSSAGR